VRRHTPAVGYVLRKFPVLSETFILNEILALESMGAEVHVFALAPSRDPRFHEGVGRLKATIHHVPGLWEVPTLFSHAKRQAGRGITGFRRQLLSVLAAGRPTLLWRFLQASYVAHRARRAGVRHLHAHFANHPATVAHQASKLLGIPFSFTAHAYDLYRQADLHDIARKMGDARFTVTVSEYNTAFLRQLANGGTPRIELIRNGVDMQRFSPPAAIPGDPFTVLAVARLVEKKGLGVLIEACRTLRDRGRDFRCEIVGKGAQKALLDGLIRQWDLRERVHLVGALAQQEIVERYHRANVLVLPCLVGQDGNRDGLPVSIVEALACGVPVISTPVTGIPEVVRDGANGLLVPERDAHALADAIERIMLDADLATRLSGAARASVVDDFDQAKTAARLHELFRAEIAAEDSHAQTVAGRAVARVGSPLPDHHARDRRLRLS
jgi:colanic acid/amylovoran biosynthesis glycosyltransferase